MGHSHTSAPLGSARELCGAPSGAGGLAAEPSSIRRPVRDADTASRGPVRDANTALNRARLSRVAVWLLLLGVRFYQAILAPLMFSVCKFFPSCSHYAAEAIARHGARRGLRLAAVRLWRCRPFTPGGYDPVPDPPEAEDDAIR